MRNEEVGRLTNAVICRLRSVDWNAKSGQIQEAFCKIGGKMVSIWKSGNTGKGAIIALGIVLLIISKVLFSSSNTPEAAIERWIEGYATGKPSEIIKSVANVNGRYDDDKKEWRLNAAENLKRLRHIKAGLSNVKWSVDDSKTIEAPDYLQKMGVDKTARVTVIFKRKSDGAKREVKFSAVRYNGEWLSRDLDLEFDE